MERRSRIRNAANKRLQRTGISVPLIDNLSLAQLSPRPLKRSVRPLGGEIPRVLIPREFHIIYTVALLAFVFVCAFFIALYINLVSERPALRYLISSAVVGVASFWLTVVVGNATLPPLRWFNGEPQNFRTSLWDHLEIIAALVAALCFTAWQLAVRKDKRRFRL
jgi:L-asparagine transporter-like permease